MTAMSDVMRVLAAEQPASTMRLPNTRLPAADADR